MNGPALSAPDDRRGEVMLPPSRESRIPPGRRLVLFPAVAAGAWTLLVAVTATAGQLFGPEEDRGGWGDVVGAVVGNFVAAFIFAVAATAIVHFAVGRRARTNRQPNGVTPSTPPNADRTVPPEQPTSAIRRVALGGVLGGLPGMLIVVVPMLLHRFGVISADQSQIGFVGVPLLVIGTFAGVSVAATDTGRAGRVMLGAAAGFVAGLALGLLADVLLLAIGAGPPATWLLLTPVGMIAGALLALRLSGASAP